jgi:glucose/arabinose dehydrogenase
LFVTLGERFSYMAEAQQLDSQLGKVVRIRTDGTFPPDNPFAAQGVNAAAVWTYGHRNPQAAVLHPVTGELWVAEHGPQGGDEVNLALAGRNFGWPTVSYGCPYGDPVGAACRYGGGTHTGAFTPPIAYWFPVSTAPGGIAFYTGSKFPEWQNHLFVGALAGKTLWRFVLDGGQATAVEGLFAGQHEIRDVKMGPDGWLYLISRSANAILRVER